MKIKLMSSILLGFLFLKAYAYQKPTSDTLRLTLENVITTALKNNPDLKRIKLNEEILIRQIQGAKGSALPQIKTTAGYTDNFALPQQLLPGAIFGQSGNIPVKFGVRHGLNAGVEANQLIFNKEFFDNIKKLDATTETYKQQTLASKEDLVYNVAKLYLQTQITNKQMVILIANFKQVEQLITIANAQFNNGIIKKLDVDQLMVNRTNLSTELSNLEIAQENQLNYLKYYLAIDLDQPIALSENLDDTKKFPVSNQLLLNENINYQLINKQKNLIELDRKVIKAGYYPSLNGFVQYKYTGQGNQFNFNTENYSNFSSGLWGLNLSMPLFDGFQKYRKLQENTLKTKQLEYDEEKIRLATQMDFKNASTKITQNEKLIAKQTENMELAKKVYGITKLSYQEGTAPLTELLNAETSLKEAQSQYLSALLNYKLAELDHVKASGQLAQIIKSI